MNAREARKRLQAAQVLLLEPSTTREKFSAIRRLVEGINPTLDATLARYDQELLTLSKVLGGEVIHLAADNLPEDTEDEKKRKRYLLLFIKGWKDLKGEVARMERELSAAEGAETGVEKTSTFGKIFNLAKGPFGIVTIIAVAAVVTMKATSVELLIQNNGCGTIQATGSIPLSLPGLKLPKDPIPSGASGTAVLPGLTVDVDGTTPGALSFKTLNFSMAFELPNNIDDVTMNGSSLLGKKTEVKLSERDKHTLALICS